MRPSVIIDPHFRTMQEIFSTSARRRLSDAYDVVWARDEPMPTRAFRDAVADADAVVFGEWRHGSDGLARSSQLAALLEVAGGHLHESLDYEECLRRGIRVGSCAPAFADVVAEMSLALALDAARGVTAASQAVEHGVERWLHDGNTRNSTLVGATVGYVGCGGIARRLHHMLTPFRVTALGFDPPIPGNVLAAQGIAPTPIDAVFDRADVIFVLAAPTPSNEGLVSAPLLRRLRPHQVLVLTSRAHLVDFDALTSLVRAGRFKAAIDVYPEEPLPEDHPIRKADAAVCTPHIAGALPAALTLIGDMVVDDLLALAAGRPPSRLQYLDDSNVGGLLQT